MSSDDSPWYSSLTYESKKRVRVYNPHLALVYYLLWLGLLVYVFVYTVGLKKGYQDYEQLTSSTTIKVKGSTGVGFGTNAIIFDDKDLVIPPLQPDSVFIITSFAKTSNQTRGICEGSSTSPDRTGELCNCSYANTTQDCCAAGDYTYNGLKLGTCGSSGVFCNLNTWCPLEPSPLNLTELDVSNWTIFFRVDSEFPKFNVGITNVHGQTGPVIGQTLFSVRDILTAARTNYSTIQTSGVIIGAYFAYDCDLNQGISNCNPTITWKRLDPVTGTSTGFNYRYADHREQNGIQFRDLYKVYGVRIVVQVSGRGGKFDFFILSTTLGSGLAIVGLSTILTDLIATKLLPLRERFYERVEGQNSIFPCLKDVEAKKEPVEMHMIKE